MRATWPRRPCGRKCPGWGRCTTKMRSRSFVPCVHDPVAADRPLGAWHYCVRSHRCGRPGSVENACWSDRGLGAEWGGGRSGMVHLQASRRRAATVEISGKRWGPIMASVVGAAVTIEEEQGPGDCDAWASLAWRCLATPCDREVRERCPPTDRRKSGQEAGRGAQAETKSGILKDGWSRAMTDPAPTQPASCRPHRRVAVSRSRTFYCDPGVFYRH
jgi:hypothetical protein